MDSFKDWAPEVIKILAGILAGISVPVGIAWCNKRLGKPEEISKAQHEAAARRVDELKLLNTEIALLKDARAEDRRCLRKLLDVADDLVNAITLIQEHIEKNEPYEYLWTDVNHAREAYSKTKTAAQTIIAPERG